MSGNIKARVAKLWGSAPVRMEPEAFLALTVEEQTRLVAEEGVMGAWNDAELAEVIERVRSGEGEPCE